MMIRQEIRSCMDDNLVAMLDDYVTRGFLLVSCTPITWDVTKEQGSHPAQWSAREYLLLFQKEVHP